MGASVQAANYRFFGWEHADVAPTNPRYASVHTPRELYDLLGKLWCAETCAPRMRDRWSPDNRTLGQCSITSFLVQDIFGGSVQGIPLQEGGFHCYNVVDGHTFDLTSEQFADQELDYTGNPEQSRETHFAKDEKRLRYERLKAGLDAMLGLGPK